MLGIFKVRSKEKNLSDKKEQTKKDEKKTSLRKSKSEDRTDKTGKGSNEKVKEDKLPRFSFKRSKSLDKKRKKDCANNQNTLILTSSTPSLLNGKDLSIEKLDETIPEDDTDRDDESESQSSFTVSVSDVTSTSSLSEKALGDAVSSTTFQQNSNNISERLPNDQTSSSNSSLNTSTTLVSDKYLLNSQTYPRKVPVFPHSFKIGTDTSALVNASSCSYSTPSIPPFFVGKTDSQSSISESSCKQSCPSAGDGSVSMLSTPSSSTSSLSSISGRPISPSGRRTPPGPKLGTGGRIPSSPTTIRKATRPNIKTNPTVSGRRLGPILSSTMANGESSLPLLYPVTEINNVDKSLLSKTTESSTSNVDLPVHNSSTTVETSGETTAQENLQSPPQSPSPGIGRPRLSVSSMQSLESIPENDSDLSSDSNENPSQSIRKNLSMKKVLPKLNFNSVDPKCKSFDSSKGQHEKSLENLDNKEKDNTLNCSSQGFSTNISKQLPLSISEKISPNLSPPIVTRKPPLVVKKTKEPGKPPPFKERPKLKLSIPTKAWEGDETQVLYAKKTNTLEEEDEGIFEAEAKSKSRSPKTSTDSLNQQSPSKESHDIKEHTYTLENNEPATHVIFRIPLTSASLRDSCKRPMKRTSSLETINSKLSSRNKDLSRSPSLLMSRKEKSESFPKFPPLKDETDIRFELPITVEELRKQSQSLSSSFRFRNCNSKLRLNPPKPKCHSKTLIHANSNDNKGNPHDKVSDTQTATVSHLSDGQSKITQSSRWPESSNQSSNMANNKPSPTESKISVEDTETVNPPSKIQSKVVSSSERDSSPSSTSTDESLSSEKKTHKETCDLNILNDSQPNITTAKTTTTTTSTQWSQSSSPSLLKNTDGNQFNGEVNIANSSIETSLIDSREKPTKVTITFPFALKNKSKNMSDAKSVNPDRNFEPHEENQAQKMIETQENTQTMDDSEEPEDITTSFQEDDELDKLANEYSESTPDITSKSSTHDFSETDSFYENSESSLIQEAIKIQIDDKHSPENSKPDETPKEDKFVQTEKPDEVEQDNSELKRVKKELSEQEVKYQSQIDDLTLKLAEKQEEVTDLVQELTEARQNSQQDSTKDKELMRQIQDLTKQMKQKENASESFKVELQYVKNENDIAKLKIQRLEDDLKRSKELVTSLQEQNVARSKDSSQVKELEEKTKKLEEDLRKSESVRKDLQDSLNDIEVERDEELKIVQDALDEAAQEREELITTFEKELKHLNSTNTAREQQMMEDFEWKLREMEKDHKKKLEEKERQLEAGLDSVRSLVESEMAESLTKMADDRKMAEEKLAKVGHLRSYEAEAIQLRGLTHELQKYLRASARENENQKIRERFLEEEIRSLRSGSQSRQTTLHRVKCQADEEESRQRMEKMKIEINSKWEDKLRSECSRLKSELDELHAEEKHLAVESMKVQKEQEMQTLKKSWERTQEEMTKEISTLKDSLTGKDAYYHKELESQRTIADRDIWDLRMKLQRLTEASFDKQQQLEEKYREDMERVRVDNDDRVRELESRLATREAEAGIDLIGEMEKKHKSQMQYIEEQHRNSMERLREELESDKFQEVEQARVMIRKHHEGVVNELKDEINQYMASTTQGRDEVESLRQTILRRDESLRLLKEELERCQESRGVNNPYQNNAPSFSPSAGPGLSSSQYSLASSSDSHSSQGSRTSQDTFYIPESTGVLENSEDTQRVSNTGILGKVFGGGWFAPTKAKDTNRRGGTPTDAMILPEVTNKKSYGT